MRQKMFVRKDGEHWCAGCQCCGGYVYADVDWASTIRYAFIHAKYQHSWTWVGLGPVGQ